MSRRNNICGARLAEEYLCDSTPWHNSYSLREQYGTEATSAPESLAKFNHPENHDSDSIPNTTIMTIDTEAWIFVPLLAESMASGDGIFGFDCGSDLGCLVLGQLYLCLFSLPLFSPRASPRDYGDR